MTTTVVPVAIPVPSAPRKDSARRARFEARAVSGVLLLDKPVGPSSNRALQEARRVFRAAKAGHAGSLDPLASGMLPVCFGEATKIAGWLLGADKAYSTECRLGVTTTTDDGEGEVLRERPVLDLSIDEVVSALRSLTGAITQVAPAFSAIKRDGVPLYRRARAGESFAPPVRGVTVHRIDLVALDRDRLDLAIECGSGTYVRSLVRDLGEALGCGAHVTALRREWVVPFAGRRMWTFTELGTLAESGEEVLDGCLIGIPDALSAFPRIALDPGAVARLRRGQSVELDQIDGPPRDRCVAVDPAGKPVALARIDASGRLRPLRGFVG